MPYKPGVNNSLKTVDEATQHIYENLIGKQVVEALASDYRAQLITGPYTAIQAAIEATACKFSKLAEQLKKDAELNVAIREAFVVNAFQRIKARENKVPVKAPVLDDDDDEIVQYKPRPKFHPSAHDYYNK